MLDTPVAIALITSAIVALVSAAGGYYAAARQVEPPKVANAAASREDRPTVE